MESDPRPIDLPCPVCGAQPSEPCLDDDGTPLARTLLHIGRLTQGAPLEVIRVGPDTYREIPS